MSFEPLPTHKNKGLIIVSIALTDKEKGGMLVFDVQLTLHSRTPIKMSLNKARTPLYINLDC